MPEAAELNIETASDELAADILGNDAPATDADDALDAAVDNAAADTGAAKADDGAAKKTDATPAAAKGNGKDAAAPAAEAPLPMPKSWAKEQQEIWDEMTPRARTQYLHREKQMLDGLEGYKGDAEYGRSLRGVLAKHADILQSQGLQAPQAVEFLFNAHRQLSSGTPEAKMAYLERVAKTYGLTLPQASIVTRAADGTETVSQPPQTPPEVKAALERLDRIEGALTAEQTRTFEAARVQAAADVEAFAADAAHPHFDECAEDIAKFIKAGEKLSDAYEKAVWANPVTRQKEISRIQQEADKANAEKVKEAAKAAKRATSTNVKGRDTTRAPTEGRATVANMDEVLRETMAEIKQRH
jgi:hypothetical protein